MPHVYKPVYTRPVPDGADRCTHRKQPAVRWKARGGRVLVGVLCGGKRGRCRVEGPVWWLAYTGADGTTRREKGYADRAASEALLAERVRTAARVAAGLLPAEAAAPRRTLCELLAAWGRHLADSGTTAKHARDRPLMASRVFDAAGAARPADLTPAKVVRAVAAVAAELELSRRTRSHHVSSVKQFTRWLVRVDRSEPADHLAGLACEADDAHPTFRRRTLPPEEFAELLAATRRSGVARRGLTGPERAALYHTAARTGLRAAELAALTPASFDLGDRPTVLARSETAKGRKEDLLPLKAEVVKELRPLLKNLPRDAKVWPHRVKKPNPGWSIHSAWWKHAAAMIALDMAAAGLAADDPAGVYDFHSLRGQFATDLERAGVGHMSAQKLMRHSSPKLTAKHYVRRSAAELAAEVEKIGRGAGRKR